MTPETPYYQFNREERNHAAILYHLLLSGSQNLKNFLGLLDVEEVYPEACEVYYEYAFLRDFWHNMDESAKRGWIKAKLPSLRQELIRGMSIAEWNTFFQVRTEHASIDKIQSPANWVTNRIEGLNDKEIKEVNEMKWCFNLKPDLVIRTSDGQMISIEAKLESQQDKYSCALNGNEGAQYSLSQLECQKRMFTKMLGIEEGSIRQVLLARSVGRVKGIGNLTWEKVFHAMDRSRSHPFVSRWIGENQVYKPKAPKSLAAG